MFVTLSAARLERSLSPVLGTLHDWLDSWPGIAVQGAAWEVLRKPEATS